ncbi:MAG: hypothetical protein ABI824_11720 [Acidobacteriota bacterium]
MRNVVRTLMAATLFLATQAVSLAVDPVGQLIERVNRGEVKLDYAKDGWGYLSSLLAHLDINKDSQLLVFSKTSFQQSKIGPKTPRAIYFNDNVMVGAVQNGEVFEFASVDPAGDIQYYTMDIAQSGPPKFETQRQLCGSCHNPINPYVTGLLVATVYPAVDGTPFFTGILFKATDHRTPFEDRWGGWYISGTHGTMKHLGNALSLNPYRPIELETKNTQNLTDLSSKFDTSKYLVPTSDLIAIMTLDHQTKITNLLTTANAEFHYFGTNELPAKYIPSPAMLDGAVDDVVRYMLFVDEAPLTSPIKGVSTFTETFPKRGPFDSKGRSLRDFDLKTRMFKYPMSYMIYSDLFDNINPTARDRILRRLYNVLTGKEVLPAVPPPAPPGPFNPEPAKSATKAAGKTAPAKPAPQTKLTAADRQAILEILRETKKNLPDYWKVSTAAR